MPLHGMRAWTGDEKGVCLSVKCVQCDKWEERSAQMFILYERSFSLVFEEKNGWWRATPSA